MTDLTVTVDKDSFVQSAQPTPGHGMRFKRQRPFTISSRRILSMQQEQELCAMYVDRPGITIDDIARKFNLKPAGVYRVLDAYGIKSDRGRGPQSIVHPSPEKLESPSTPRQAPAPPVTRSAPTLVPVPIPTPALLHQTVVSQPTIGVAGVSEWRVSVRRTTVEEVEASLLDLAAKYEGSEKDISMIERV